MRYFCTRQTAVNLIDFCVKLRLSAEPVMLESGLDPRESDSERSVSVRAVLYRWAIVGAALRAISAADTVTLCHEYHSSLQ